MQLDFTVSGERNCVRCEAKCLDMNRDGSVPEGKRYKSFHQMTCLEHSRPELGPCELK